MEEETDSKLHFKKPYKSKQNKNEALRSHSLYWITHGLKQMAFVHQKPLQAVTCVRLYVWVRRKDEVMKKVEAMMEVEASKG